MKKKPQPYHPASQKFFPHPGSSKEVTRRMENKRIQEENNELIKRLEERKYIYGPYSYNKSEPNFQQQRYYRSQILKRGSVANPFLNYVTPREFQRNFLFYMNEGHKEKGKDHRRVRSEYKNSYNSTWSNTGDSRKPYSANKNKIKIERIEINADAERI